MSVDVVVQLGPQVPPTSPVGHRDQQHYVCCENSLQFNHNKSMAANQYLALRCAHSAYSDLGVGVAPGHQNAFSVVPQFRPNGFLTCLLISGYHQFVVPNGTRRTDT